MDQSLRECYGFAVQCSAHPDAKAVIDEFFGADIAARPDRPVTVAPVVRLTVEVTDDAKAPTVNPPHTVELMRNDPIEVDTGGSRAVLRVAESTAHITLARRDLDDPIVWGHWILERLFLYLVCRSPRHYPLHAGAIGVDGRSAIVSGPTGAGKSTFSYWAHRGGADLISEDIMVRHLGDRPGRFWGYPHAVYLDREVFQRSPELAGVPRVDYYDGDRSRVSLAAVPQQRLRSAAEPSCLVFLARGEAAVRDVGADEAVERSRDDFATAKDDEAVVAEVEADLRRWLADRPAIELTVPDDLDAGYDLLRKTLKSL